MNRRTHRYACESARYTTIPRSGATGRNRGASRALSPTEAACLLVLACALVVVAATSAARPAADTDVATTVHVRPGQTLWELAIEHPVLGQSTAQTVETIRSINDLDSDRLAIGARLLVPANEHSTAWVAAR